MIVAMVFAGIDLGYLSIVFGVILLSMTLHEAMHAFAAYWLGDDTARGEGRLTLNPLRHIDPFLTILLPLVLALTGAPIFGGAKPVPFNPHRVRFGEYGAALVGIAGPLTNLILSFVFFVALVLIGLPMQGTWIGEFIKIGVIVNLGFFIFNMLPIPPLDGSRVLYAIAPEGVRRFMSIVEQYGLVFIFVIVLLLSDPLGRFIITVQEYILSAYGALFGVRVV